MDEDKWRVRATESSWERRDLGPEKLSSMENQPAREPADLSPGLV